ncbi:MAG: porin, partial [Saprospiraceae bacterium]|nr:porin [Saprospiraceae bacterium]
MTSHSTISFMTLDAPIFNFVNIETTDQFARQFGVYAKGQIGKLDYRI